MPKILNLWSIGTGAHAIWRAKLTCGHTVTVLPRELTDFINAKANDTAVVCKNCRVKNSRS